MFVVDQSFAREVAGFFSTTDEGSRLKLRDSSQNLSCSWCCGDNIHSSEIAEHSDQYKETGRHWYYGAGARTVG
jgi:hypothetical protein